MDWRDRFAREGGAIACKGNCPTHMSCTGRIRPVDARADSQRIDGFDARAECDTCHALFGFVHAALRYLDHTSEWKHTVKPGKLFGVP